MNQSQMIKIQISPKNIPNLVSTKVQFKKQESLFQQARGFVFDQNEDIDQQNIICYSNQKKRVIYEQDTVDSLFEQEEKPEIELYLFNDILNTLVPKQEQKSQNIKQQCQCDLNFEKSKKEIAAMGKQIEMLYKERNEFRDKCNSLEDSLRKMKLQQQEIPNVQNDQQNITDVESYKLKYQLEQSIKLTTQLKDAKSKLEMFLSEKEKELNEKQQQLDQAKYTNLSLQQDYNNTQNDKQQLEGKLQKLREEIQKSHKKQDKLEADIQQQNIIYKSTQVNLDNVQQQSRAKDELISQRNKILNEQEKQINELLNENKLLKQGKEKLQSEYTNMNVDYKDKLQLLQKAENNLKFVSYFIENNPFKQLNELFITPIDAMFRKKLNPYEFEKQQNANTNKCDATVITLSIESGQNLLQWLQFKSDKSINQFIKRSPLQKLKVIKSINKDGQGSKSKCFLMLVQNTYNNDKSFENQVFALKMIDGHDEIKKEEHAIFLAYQIFVAQVLAECFQNKILKSSPPYKFQFSLPHLFTIGENIYIGQQLLNKDYKSFQQNVNHSEIKLFNAFSQFTNNFTSGALIVTNFKGGQFNGNQYILYEPIIHTPGGIFSPEDQGQLGIDLFLQSLGQNPELTGQEYLQGINYNI